MTMPPAAATAWSGCGSGSPPRGGAASIAIAASLLSGVLPAGSALLLDRFPQG
ncbi:hypothetical protein J0910_15715 [Nocardiopsis sp. CNT-189]|uniref:hypothetical protein n=1 Tax=Nocardiopsis oceanisediminis TaxID=2816862 RepID=UPI003B2E51E7